MKNNLTFPIVEMKDNKIINTEGEVSYIYEIVSDDVTQMNQLELNNFFSEVSKALNGFDCDDYFKFYQLEGRAFLNTSFEKEIFFNEKIKLIPCTDFFEAFFNGNDIFSDVFLYDDYLTMNGQYTKIISVLEFSDTNLKGSFIPFDIDYVLNVKRIESQKSLKNLERARKTHSRSFLKKREDHKGEGAYHQANELMKKVELEESSLFEIELFFIVKANTKKELDKLTKEIINFFKREKLKLFTEGHSLLKLKTSLGMILRELIAGVWPKLGIRSHVDTTDHLRYLLPLKRSFLMEDGIKFHDQQEREIFFNPFDESLKNKNMLISGQTGSGKSVFVNKLLNSLIEDHPTLILDNGGSFKRLTQYHSGTVMKEKFNPLQFKDAFYLKELILSVVGKDEFNKLEKGKLLFEIRRFIKENESNDFFKLLTFLEKEFKGISLYFEEIKDNITKDILKEENVLYVDIEKISPNVVAPLIIFLLEYFKNMKKKEGIFIFDECWMFLKDHADFISKCFRTFRKKGYLPIAISQEYKDFNSEIASSIKNNCYFECFFPQEDSDTLDDFEKDLMKSLEYEKGIFSDCYLRSSDGKIRKIIRIFLSSLEYELFHTDDGKDNCLNKFIKEQGGFFPSYKEAISRFVEMRYE